MVRAFDMDGVLADFDNAFRDLIKDQTGIELPVISSIYPDVWSYHFAAGVTQEQNDQLWKTIMEGDFWETLKPLPDCPAALAQLRERRGEGDSIYFVTSRPGRYAKHLTEFWLDAQGYECPTVIIANGAWQKAAVCKGLEVGVFIDDKWDNCLAVSAALPSTTQVYLLDRPHNRQTLSSRELVSRVGSVLDPRVIGATERVA